MRYKVKHWLRLTSDERYLVLFATAALQKRKAIKELLIVRKVALYANEKVIKGLKIIYYFQAFYCF
nr:hypothetical protein [Priestia megaterium]MDH3179849.1 hypothetical protein [Priestia megaterium]